MDGNHVKEFEMDETNEQNDRNKSNRMEDFNKVSKSTQQLSCENEFKIVRKGSASDMFYREPNKNELIPNKDIPFLTLSLLSGVIKENIQTLCLLLLGFPNVVFGIYVFFTYDYSPCKNDSALLIYHRITGIYSIILKVMYFVMSLYLK